MPTTGGAGCWSTSGPPGASRAARRRRTLERFQRQHGGPKFTVLGIDSRDLSGDGARVRRAATGSAIPSCATATATPRTNTAPPACRRTSSSTRAGRCGCSCRGPVDEEYLRERSGAAAAGGQVVSVPGRLPSLVLALALLAPAGAARAGRLADRNRKAGDVPRLRHAAAAGRIAAGAAREGLHRPADRRRQDRSARSRTRWSPSTATRCWRCRPGSGFSLSAYLVPIVAFLVAVVALAIGVLRWRRAGGGGPDGRRRAAGPSDEDAERLDADLARYDL